MNKGAVMQAYLNSPELKTRFLEEIGKHETADQLIQGAYKEGSGATFRGCAIGCSLHSLNIIGGLTAKTEGASLTDHSRYTRELGLPLWLAYLEDNLFERLPIALAKTWPRRFAEAIPVGVVVGDVVLAKILRWSLADPTFGARFATDNEEVRGHIDGVIVGFDAEIATNGHASAEQREAAAWAAWDAWAAWAARDAWAAFYPALSEYVLQLLRELTV